MAKKNQLRQQSAEELKVTLEDLTKEIYQLRNAFKTTKKVEKSHLIREKKRQRARILTLLREQELQIMQSEGVHGKT